MTIALVRTAIDLGDHHGRARKHPRLLIEPSGLLGVAEYVQGAKKVTGDICELGPTMTSRDHELGIRTGRVPSHKKGFTLQVCVDADVPNRGRTPVVVLVPSFEGTVAHALV